MDWWKQVITGRDNETVAIGRVLGIVVAVVFLFLVPIASIILLERNAISAAEWSAIFQQLTVYVPAILVSVGGVIGLTASSEPKGPDQ